MCVFLALPLIMFSLRKITRCWQPQSGQVASVPSPITQKHFATTLLQNDLAVTPSMCLFSSNRGGSLMTTSDICLLSLGRTISSYYHHYHCIVTCSLLYIAEMNSLIVRYRSIVLSCHQTVMIFTTCVKIVQLIVTNLIDLIKFYIDSFD